MTAPDHIIKASKAAEDVYIEFLEKVVDTHVVNDRENVQIGEKTLKNVASGKSVDPRVVRLMSISGKGGYSPDPAKQKIYRNYRNVNLLDHLLSVTRGALMLSALDMIHQNPEMDLNILTRKLKVIAAISFMHDLDKDKQLKRNEPLCLEDVEERAIRYGIDIFLNEAEASLAPDQFRYLIEKVESTQAHRHAPDTLPPREFEPLPLYVRIADKLDGAWLSTHPETGGIKGVLARIEKDESCLRCDILKEWKEVHLFDPHHPFLIDELQRWLSMFSFRLAGVYPLIEVHQDGHLFMLLPEANYDEIVKQGVDLLAGGLPFKLELTISVVGIPALHNGQPSHTELETFVENELSAKNFSDLFKIKRAIVSQLTEFLDEMLENVGLQPCWPEKSVSALVTLYATLKNIDDSDMEWLYRAAHLVMLFNLKIKAKAKDGIPDYEKREIQLLDAVGEVRPDIINEIEDGTSRRTITALWVTSLAFEEDDIENIIWGEDDGLLKKWLEGEDEKPGLNQFFEGRGPEILDGVRHRLLQLLSGKRVVTKNEGNSGRCLFTNEPVEFKQTIEQATGLYGVKVSAFSGRDGRPESITSERSHTNVGNSSTAEHKLRSTVHKIQGGRNEGVPALISSSTTSGLFGGLGITSDRAMGAMSMYDLNRLEIKKGKSVVKGAEIFHGRHRFARLERIPEALQKQADAIRMILIATRRIGRPIHIFRGLPTLQTAYFYFDAMPQVLENILGGKSLSLEQIPQALQNLAMAQKLLETKGLGYDVLRLFANTSTRFGAICMAWSYLKDKEDKSTHLIHDLYQKFFDYMEDKKAMNERDGALVILGEVAAGVQKNPGFNSSASEQLLVFKLCLEAVNEARIVGQEDEKSLVYAIAGELETNLVRKDKAAARKWRNDKNLSEGCIELAEFFVKEVWKKVMKGKNPSQKTRRILSSIYRMAFLNTHRERYQEKETK